MRQAIEDVGIQAGDVMAADQVHCLARQTERLLAADGVLIIAAVPLLLILMIGSAASSRN